MSPPNAQHNYFPFLLTKLQTLIQGQPAADTLQPSDEPQSHYTPNAENDVIVIHDTAINPLQSDSIYQRLSTPVSLSLSLLQAPAQTPSSAAASAPFSFNDFDEYDTQPIDLQDFIADVGATNAASRTFLEYVTTATPAITLSASSAAAESTHTAGNQTANMFASTKLSAIFASTSLPPLASVLGMDMASQNGGVGSVGGSGTSSDSNAIAIAEGSSIFALHKQFTNLSWLSFYGNHTNLAFDPEWDYQVCTNVYNPTLDANRLEFWVCGIMLNIIGILGVIGNIISMIILSRPQMRSSINYLLIGLARCDTVLILTSMFLFGIPSIYPYTGHFFYYYNDIYPFISPGMYPVAMIVQTASIYMTFTVTLERYVAVCHPLKSRALCTYGRARIYFFVCLIFSILYNLPRFWEVKTVTYQPLPDTDVILHCVRPSMLRRNAAYKHIYIHWCYLIVNYIIPFLTLAVLNCLIYSQVKRANHERQRLSRSEKREIGLATMLLCVVIVFFVLNFPALILNISEAFYDTIDPSLTKISNLLVTINSSCNFLIYVIFGEKFKRLFLLIFFKRRLSRDQPDLIHYESSISNNGDGSLNHRSSSRLSRHGTQRSTTTYLVAGSGNNTIKGGRLSHNANIVLYNTGADGTPSGSSAGIVKIKRHHRAPSPGQVVFYPAKEVRRASPSTSNKTNPALGCDWVNAKNGQTTTGF